MEKTMENEERIDVGTLIANVLMASNQDNFEENMNRFIDETAEILGDFIGASCENPALALNNFGTVMIEAAQKRIDASNAMYKP